MNGETVRGIWARRGCDPGIRISVKVLCGAERVRTVVIHGELLQKCRCANAVK